MANDLHKQERYKEAIDVYSKSIELNPTATYYGNRSAAYLKLSRFNYALDDATKAIEIDKAYSKGYTRRADANMALEQYSLALEDYMQAKRIDSNNTRLSALITKCQELLPKHSNCLSIN